MDLPIDPDDVRAALRDHGVRFALVFGSHATGRARPGSDVDLVDLRSVGEGLAGRVAMEGRVVLDDDPVARVRWQAQTRTRHLDEAHRRERFRKDFVRSHG